MRSTVIRVVLTSGETLEGTLTASAWGGGWRADDLGWVMVRVDGEDQTLREDEVVSITDSTTGEDLAAKWSRAAIYPT